MSNYKHKRHAGGTFLGLILGLVIGLAIAIVVAVMIMKTPIPFSNKQARPDRATEAATVTDPNQPLYGKRETVKPIVPNGGTLPPTAPLAPPPATANVPPPVRSPAPTTGHAPIVENSLLEKSKKVEPKADAKADEQWIYYLQVGAFRSRDDAESTRARLALLGFEASVSERQSDQGVLYRVRLGPFAQIDATNRVRSKLIDNGVDAAVVRAAR